MPDHYHRVDHPPTQPPPTAALTPSAAHARCLGARMRQAREAAHLTQRELGGSRFSKSYVSAVEHGKLTPSVQALARLAERLGQPFSYFFGEEAPAPPSLPDSFSRSGGRRPEQPLSGGTANSG